jgi:hypothetical protein
MRIALWITAIVTGCMLTRCTTEKGEVPEPLPCDTSMITYSNTIQNIIATNCTTTPGCHQPGSSEGDMTSYELLMIKVNSGAFRQRVIVDKTMPPTEPLSIEDRQKIECWLREEARQN